MARSFIDVSAVAWAVLSASARVPWPAALAIASWRLRLTVFWVGPQVKLVSMFLDDSAKTSKIFWLS